MEECSEIQKEISKSMRFGLGNYHPLTPEITNEDNLLEEYYQLQAVIEYLQNVGVIKIIGKDKIQRIKQNKIDKVLKYEKLSERIGMIIETGGEIN